MNGDTSTMSHEEEMQQTGSNSRDALVGGVVLIGLGALFLLAQLVDVGSMVLPILSTVFIAAGVISRSAGWFIPGGILGGIALGSTANDLIALPEDSEGGLFLLFFALGWVSITVLSRLFTRENHNWALIPAGIMALIGSAVLAGDVGRNVLGLTFSVANYIWPLALIGVGSYLIWQQRRSK
jgi:hypothetical protein